MSDPVSLGSLVVLALIDSTSFGTLLIPIWLLMTPGRVRMGKVLLFLGTVALSYFAIGLAVMLGASAMLESCGWVIDTQPFRVVQLVIGVTLVVASYLMDNKRTRARATDRAATGGGRIAKWRARAMGQSGATTGTTAALLGLAMAAVLAEVATMIPYLAAIGIITTQGPGWPGDAALLGGYCLIMIAPALILTIARVGGGSAVERPLARLDQWLSKNAQSTTAWVIGIVGVILGLRALGHLGWLSAAPL